MLRTLVILFIPWLLAASAQPAESSPFVLPALPPLPHSDGQPPAEVVALQPQPKQQAQRPSGKLQEPPPGFKLVLSGELTEDLVLGPEKSPALVRGVLLVPAGRVLALKPGAVLMLQADETAQSVPPTTLPSPSPEGHLWVVGTLHAEGARIGSTTGGSIFLYGKEASMLRGVKLERLAVTQTSGSAQWLGCTFQESPHYALAAGAAIFVQCTFAHCGGLLAAYDQGPWALMAVNNSFEACREGLVIGGNPGDEGLIFRKNSFVNTAGANLRAQPAQTDKRGLMEVLIGENWYGSAEPEAIDGKIIDHRSDPKIRARLNVRPPAQKAYSACGAKVSAEILAKAFREWEPVGARLLGTYEKKASPKWEARSSK